MDFFSILILGIVQGITEWVPISSKTQDTLVYLKFLHGDPSLVLPILLYLHVGTVLAAIIYFRKELLQAASTVLKNPLKRETYSEGETGFLFAALVATGIVGLPLLLAEKKLFPTLDASLLYLLMGLGLLVTGALLLSQKQRNTKNIQAVGWKDGAWTGLLQGLSVLPGVSRSGTSTTGLIWRGFDSQSSFHLSFLLSVPTVVLAELVFYLGGESLRFPVVDGLLLALASFIFGYLTLEAVLRIVKRVNLAYLAFALGLITIAAAALGAG